MFTVVNIPELPTTPENNRIPLVDDKPIEDKQSTSPVVINMEPHLTPSASSVRSLKKKKSKLSLNEIDAERERKMKEKKIKMDNSVLAMGQRLTIRKKIHNRL